LVLVLTRENIKNIRAPKETCCRSKAEGREQAQTVGDELAGVSLIISMRTGEEGKLFGSVTNIQIEKALKAKGLNVDRRKIHLDEPIKTLESMKFQSVFPLTLACR